MIILSAPDGTTDSPYAPPGVDEADRLNNHFGATGRSSLCRTSPRELVDEHKEGHSDPPQAGFPTPRR